ncbi:nuclear transport factor 2 family protein [Amycolatopsis rhabdoformis]|uniref:Nuclear transport factor 2 family protein n=1 Tax=Amycolatopsis rhabdoformis TaxID=1448059 RepID=A0ABZ1IIP7_9PSEU|nr:nuclear transport factor 2 family protein [Amycolatopsis rhabdoformis]WSE34048.1 nuclear transport factor 2 family protein [Amycolatopsis rhabdoformis]
MDASQQNKALVLAFYSDLSAGNLPGALGRLDENLEYRIGGHPAEFPLAGVHSKSELIDVLGAIGAAVPDGVQVEIFSAIAEGSQVVVEFIARGVSATGKTYENRVAFSCEVADGKIRKVREYLDTLHANTVLMEKSA